jgi:hypothetical protein
MTAPQLRHSGIVQNAYVVEDLTEACRRFSDTLGIGPFFRGERHPMRDVRYRGRPAPEPVVIEIALAQAGDVQIELIQQHSPGPSAYRDVFAKGEEGLHHVAVFAGDYAGCRQSLVDAGFEVAMDIAGLGDYEICYVDTTAAFGHMLEIYPEHPALRRLYAFVRAAAEQWDGRDPIRPLDLANPTAGPPRSA